MLCGRGCGSREGAHVLCVCSWFELQQWGTRALDPVERPLGAIRRGTMICHLGAKEVEVWKARDVCADRLVGSEDGLPAAFLGNPIVGI